MILPWSVLALLFAAVYARVVRGNMIDTMSEDYIRTARAKGLGERQVVTRHAMRAGLSPIITLLGIDLALLIGNTVVTETVFNMPGLGNYILVSTDAGDLPAVLAVVVIASLAVAILALVADVVHALLDPRIRLR
jgi:peptide/nickel transport system permease protein